MQKTTKRYDCFNDAPKDEQEKIMSELYFKITKRTVICNAFLRFHYIIFLILVYFTIMPKSQYFSVTLLLMGAFIFLWIFKSINSIKYKHIDADSTFMIEQFREQLNKISILIDEYTLYTSHPYEIITGTKYLYGTRYRFCFYYVRALYSNDDIIELLDNYTKNRTLKPYKNSRKSLFHISTKKYVYLQLLIKDGKTQEVHELLEKICK